MGFPKALLATGATFSAFFTLASATVRENSYFLTQSIFEIPNETPATACAASKPTRTWSRQIGECWSNAYKNSVPNDDEDDSYYDVDDYYKNDDRMEDGDYSWMTACSQSSDYVYYHTVFFPNTLNCTGDSRRWNDGAIWGGNMEAQCAISNYQVQTQWSCDNVDVATMTANSFGQMFYEDGVLDCTAPVQQQTLRPAVRLVVAEHSADKCINNVPAFFNEGANIHSSKNNDCGTVESFYFDDDCKEYSHNNTWNIDYDCFPHEYDDVYEDASGRQYCNNVDEGHSKPKPHAGGKTKPAPKEKAKVLADFAAATAEMDASLAKMQAMSRSEIIASINAEANGGTAVSSSSSVGYFASFAGGVACVVAGLVAMKFFKPKTEFETLSVHSSL